jgi:hypothetical protein
MDGNSIATAILLGTISTLVFLTMFFLQNTSGPRNENNFLAIACRARSAATSSSIDIYTCFPQYPERLMPGRWNRYDRQ